MQKIIYKINDINYIFFEVEISGTRRPEIEKQIKKIGGLILSIKSGKRFLWKKSILIKYLIPEKIISNLRNIKQESV